MNKPAIFFDRDGTLIADKHYLNDPNQVEYLPGVFPMMRRLRDAGFQFFVVTNQSGLARGLVDLAQMDAIHRRMQEDMARQGLWIQKFYYAPFLDGHGRQERKPGARLLELAAQDYGVRLQDSWMIGDHPRDVEAGLRAGCRALLLSSNPQALPQELAAQGAQSVSTLDEVAPLILRQSPFGA